MDIYFSNTLTRKKDKFTPLKAGKVGIYTCGPTVYGRAHIGNLRAYLFADSLCRVLRFNNYKVKQVMNITDVGHLVSDADDGEDKMAVAAREQQKSPLEIAKIYTDLFVSDCNKLNITPPTLKIKATDCINDMINYVEVLVDKGYAYEITDGVYFDISKFANYGCLSGLDLNNQQAGARIEVNQEKISPCDFAVWKQAPPEHIMQWPSPWGMGYPGWHIECSTISNKYLGEKFDIHTGGIDHIPIHHENEIAQSYGFSGKIPANVWMHSEFIQIDKGKMSKSLGNTYSLDDLIEKGFEPAAYRYMCFNAHYSKQLNFTWDGIKAAQTAMNRLRMSINKLSGLKNVMSEEVVQEYLTEFNEAINDDLNMPKAMAILWDIARGNAGGENAIRLISKFETVLALDLFNYEEEKQYLELNENQQKLIKERAAARKSKNWARADEIRDLFTAQGIELVDTKDGVKALKK